MSLSTEQFDEMCDAAVESWRQSLPAVGNNAGPLTRQQKRQIERKARKYIEAMDRDLVERIKAEKRQHMMLSARSQFLHERLQIAYIDPTQEWVPPSQRGMIS